MSPADFLFLFLCGVNKPDRYSRPPLVLFLEKVLDARQYVLRRPKPISVQSKISSRKPHSEQDQQLQASFHNRPKQQLQAPFQNKTKQQIVGPIGKSWSDPQNPTIRVARELVDDHGELTRGN